MTNILTLLRNGLIVTSLDIDNALYMTSVVDQVKPKKRQQQFIFWGLLVEYVGRLALILFFSNVFSGSEPLFVLFGIPFSIVSISLIAAGLFLTIRSGRDLWSLFMGGDEAEVAASDIEGKSVGRIFVEMMIISLMLSIDTIVAVGTTGQSFGYLAVVLSISVLLRYLFIFPISHFLQKYPNINFIILTFLIIIGVSLVLEGFGTELPQKIMNVVMALVTLIVIFIERYRFKHKEENQ